MQCSLGASSHVNASCVHATLYGSSSRCDGAFQWWRLVAGQGQLTEAQMVEQLETALAAVGAKDFYTIIA